MIIPSTSGPVDAGFTAGQEGRALLSASRGGIFAVFNASSGGGRRVRRGLKIIAEAFALRGIRFRAVFCAGERDFAAALRVVRSMPSGLVIAGGGDGTVGTLAGALAGSEKILAPLPLGTWNHFVRDVGLPSSPGSAVSAWLNSEVRRVDVAEVNGRVFINNSSIGLYPFWVLGRRAYQELGYRRWHAFWLSAFRTMRLMPRVAARIHMLEGDLAVSSPIIFVGNNDYARTGTPLGRRESLNGGRLSLFVARRTARQGILGLAVKAALGLNGREVNYRRWLTHRIRIETDDAVVPVALDGEVVAMRAPLEYRILPGALKVLAPPRPLPGGRV